MRVSDYYVVSINDGKPLRNWRLEIRRHNSSMGVKLTGGEFASQAAAELAGRNALREFLIELLKEERRE